MWRFLRSMVIGGLIVAAVIPGTSVGARRLAGLSTTQVIQISSTSTRVLDAGTNADISKAPPGWTAVGFDDSTWDHPIPVSSTILACMQGHMSGWAPSLSTPYWDTNEGDSMLARQDFTLSPARNYNSSTVTVGSSPNGSGGTDIFVNGHQIAKYDSLTHLSTNPIGAYLKAGANVLAIYADPGNTYSATSSDCSGLAFTLNLRLSDVGFTPQAKPAYVSVLIPSQNSDLTGNTLPFQWLPFPSARYYYLQIWLVSPAPHQVIDARTITTFTARLTGTTYTLHTSHMPKGLYSWRMAAVSQHGKLLSDWTPERSIRFR